MRLTCLSTANHIMTFKDSRQDVSLDRCQLGVSAKLNVLEHDGVETSVLELPSVSEWSYFRRKDSRTFLTGWTCAVPSKVTLIDATLPLISKYPMNFSLVTIAYLSNSFPD